MRVPIAAATNQIPDASEQRSQGYSSQIKVKSGMAII